MTLFEVLNNESMAKYVSIEFGNERTFVGNADDIMGTEYVKNLLVKKSDLIFNIFGDAEIIDVKVTSEEPNVPTLENVHFSEAFKCVIL